MEAAAGTKEVSVCCLIFMCYICHVPSGCHLFYCVSASYSLKVCAAQYEWTTYMQVWLVLGRLVEADFADGSDFTRHCHGAASQYAS